MKTCDYCGRESQDEAVCCQECGTAFAKADSKPADTTDWAWAADGFKWVSTVFLIVCIYLLSLGPVVRCFATATIVKTSPPTTFPNSNGNTTVLVSSRTVRYPAWIGWIYYPVFKLLESGGRFGSISDLYQRYLDWWIEKSASK